MRAIVAITEEGSFTAAATSLGLAQSSLSRSIQEAERRLRVPLFQRSTRKLEVTADGEAIAQVARAMINQFDAGMLHIEGYLKGTQGHITIATLPSLAATLLPPIIRKYQLDFPDVEVHVLDCLSEQVIERLQSGVADVAVTVEVPNNDAFNSKLIAKDSFYVAVRSDHEFANLETIRWVELNGKPLIQFTNTSSVQQGVASALEIHEVEPATTMRAQNVAAVAGLVAAGLGIAPVPGFVIPLMSFAGLNFIPLSPTHVRRIALIRDPARPFTPAASAWVEILQEYLISSKAQFQGVDWNAD